MKELQCMSFTSKGASEIIVAGWQNTMFIIDVNKGEIVKQVSAAARSRITLRFPSGPPLTRA